MDRPAARIANRRWPAWTVAAASAAVGVAVALAAAAGSWTGVRAVGVMTATRSGFLRVTPRWVDVAVWGGDGLWIPDWFGPNKWSSVWTRRRLSVLTHAGSRYDADHWLRSIDRETDATTALGGFVYLRGLNDLLSVPSYRELSAPTWVVLAVTWAPLAYRLGRSRRIRRRRPAVCCPSCGYDLRATPERCPECGATCWATTAPVPGEGAG